MKKHVELWNFLPKMPIHAQMCVILKNISDTYTQSAAEKDPPRGGRAEGGKKCHFLPKFNKKVDFTYNTQESAFLCLKGFIKKKPLFNQKAVSKGIEPIF